MLVITREGDPRLLELFGDQGVFFLHAPSHLSELRSGIQEVIGFRDACAQLDREGRSVPAVEESTPVDGWLELTGPSHPVFLRRFRNWVETLEDLGLEAGELQRLVHAVREVGWNAIEWGNHFETQRRLNMSFLILDDSVLFRIQNENIRSGDWRAELENMDSAEELQQSRAERGIRPGGLGMTLVKSIVDRMDVSSHGNIVILEKKINRTRNQHSEEQEKSNGVVLEDPS